MTPMTNILMVCTANICRSPMAQMVGAHLAQKAGMAKSVKFDSAGTQAGRMREPADPRTRSALEKRDYPTFKTRSRQITTDDFMKFDLILAMDHSHLSSMRDMCPQEHAHKIRLFLDFAPALGINEVPDPYFGGPQGFENILDLCEAATTGLLAHIRSGAAL